MPVVKKILKRIIQIDLVITWYWLVLQRVYRFEFVKEDIGNKQILQYFVIHGLGM